MAATFGIQTPESYRVIILPANERPVTPLPKKRRYRFIKRLIQLADSALGETPHAAISRDSIAPAAPIMATACSTCRGKCCLRGGTRAYLHASTIRRVAARIGVNATVDDILRAYWQHLPVETYRHSCVFHSRTGCGLPPPMRSTTCLNTICSGIAELRNRNQLDGESDFFLAAANSMRIVRGRFDIWPHATPSRTGSDEVRPNEKT